MARNEVVLRFAGDSKQLERTFDRVGDGAKEMAGDLDSASAKARGMGNALDRAGEASDASESKFMGMADLLDGLGGAFGLPTEGATNLMRSFGDLTGGFAALQPMIGTVGTAMKGFAATLLTPPMGIVVGVAALVAALVVAYQKSETFRDIVNGVFRAVGNVAVTIKDAVVGAVGWIIEKLGDVVGFVAGLPARIRGAASGMWDGVKDAFRGALNWIIDRWNNFQIRLGGQRVDLPFGQGFTIPAITLDTPDVPRLAAGGFLPAGQAAIVGERGPELFVPGRAGTVVPNGGGAPIVVQLQLDGRQITEVVIDGLYREQRRSGVVSALVA